VVHLNSLNRRHIFKQERPVLRQNLLLVEGQHELKGRFAALLSFFNYEGSEHKRVL
jgi:hypothetical protein